MAETKLFINGEWTAAASGETFPTFAPSTGEKIGDALSAGKRFQRQPRENFLAFRRRLQER